MNCIYCQQQTSEKDIYCPHCGKLIKETRLPRVSPPREVVQIVIYYMLVVLVVGIAQMRLPLTAFESDLLSNILLTGVTLLFCFFQKSWFNGLFDLKRVQWKIMVVVILISVAFSVAVWGFASAINHALFEYIQVNYLDPFQDLPQPLLFAILFTAVYPGVVEEIGFRGLLLTGFSRNLRAREAIILGGLVFAFAHFSFISFLWLLPMGIFYSYMRYRYRTLYYGIAAHIVHNAVVVYMSYLSLF